jgi:hypothetical protein
MQKSRRATVGLGLSLVGVGVALLLAQWVGWDRFWPIFPILGGPAFLAGYAASDPRDPGLAFLGTGALLVGLFFFGFSLGQWEWGEMARLWPIWPLIGGLTFLALFLAQGRSRDPGLLGFSLAALAVGVVGLLVTHGLVGREVIKYWPLLLVLMGVTGLLAGLLRAVRRA